ncbi:uracil-DNA glycosylase family protein [Prosthecomicrobium sp. N25]|uniref:uracil-DNA glycosylase family protein n=1 Tax=Prosthecomicrobium sp. N25 TaxID=3129254 RepID=UPI0030786A80
MLAVPPEDLAALARDIAACRICRDRPAGAPLPHEPRPVAHLSATARVLVAGQAPGTKVHASGLPFDDASGDRLRAWMGIGRDLFYDQARLAFLPMGFCFPGQDEAGGDLPPRRECAGAWRARAVAAMPQVELVLAVGQYAQAWHLGRERPAGMTATVRAWRAILEASRRPRILPLPHPSWRNSGWLKRNPWFEAELLPALRAEIRGLVGDTE